MSFFFMLSFSHFSATDCPNSKEKTAGGETVATLLKVIGAVVFFAAIVFVVALVLAYPTMWLVNYLFAPSALVAVFGTAAIGFWKAFWLNFFFGVAFKSSASSSSKD